MAPTGTCRIKNVYKNRYLDTGNKYNADRIHLDLTSYQVNWYIAPNGDGNYRIKTGGSYKELYAADFTYNRDRRYAFVWNPGNPVLQGSWDITHLGNKRYLIRNVRHNEYLYCADIPNENWIFTWGGYSIDLNNNTKFHWHIESDDELRREQEMREAAERQRKEQLRKQAEAERQRQEQLRAQQERERQEQLRKEAEAAEQRKREQERIERERQEQIQREIEEQKEQQRLLDEKQALMNDIQAIVLDNITIDDEDLLQDSDDETNQDTTIDYEDNSEVIIRKGSLDNAQLSVPTKSTQ